MKNYIDGFDKSMKALPRFLHKRRVDELGGRQEEVTYSVKNIEGIHENKDLQMLGVNPKSPRHRVS